MEGLTLVPEAAAKKGFVFTFLGANPGDECKDCPLQKLCFNLEAGRRYEVDEVRDLRHPCNLHDEGKVRVVKVKPAGVTTSVEAKRLRGTAVTWNPIDCGFPECANWKLCHPTGLAEGARYAVESEEPLECPMHYQLRKVRFAP